MKKIYRKDNKYDLMIPIHYNYFKTKKKKEVQYFYI